MVYGAIKIIVRDRLATHAYPFAIAGLDIGGNFNAIGRDHHTARIVKLYDPFVAHVGKTGMGGGKDKAPSCFEQPSHPLE